MLENPYSAARVDLPEDSTVFRGEGRIEEATDGQRIAIWFESTLEEGIAAQWRMQELFGTTKTIRQLRRVLPALGALLILLQLLDYATGGRQIFGPALSALGIAVVGFCFLMPWLVHRSFRRSVRKIAIAARGTDARLEVGLEIAPDGIHARHHNQEIIFFWRGVRDVEVAADSLLFYCEPLGLAQLPLRVFPDKASFERCLALVKRFREAAPN